MSRDTVRQLTFALFFACLPGLAGAQIGDLGPLDEKERRSSDQANGEITEWGFTVGLAVGRANVTFGGDGHAYVETDEGEKLFIGGGAGLLYRAIERKYTSGWVLDLTLRGDVWPNLTDLDQFRLLLLSGAEIGFSRGRSSGGSLRPYLFLGPGYSIGSLGDFASEDTKVGGTGLILAYGVGLEFAPASQPLSVTIGVRKISRGSSEGTIMTWEGEPVRVDSDEADLLGVIELRWRRYR